MKFDPVQGDERSRPMEPYRVPRWPSAHALVDEVKGLLLAREDTLGARARKRKADALETFEATVSALVSDATHQHLVAPGAWLTVPMSKRLVGTRNQYRAKVHSKKFPDVVKALASPELGVLKLRLGCQTFGRKADLRSLIQAGPRLIELITKHEVGIDDFRRTAGGETIVLKRSREGIFDQSKAIPYQDTPETIVYRDQMRLINEWLAAADITFDEGAMDGDDWVDDQQRYLRRVFNASEFHKGGRMYGGFWINMKKQARRDGLWIKEDRTVGLDFGQTMVRILYGLAGADLPPGDLYAVPGFTGNREGIKKVFNAMVAACKPMTQFPKGTNTLFPKKVTFADVATAITAFHSPIASMFYRGLALDGWFIESGIMVDVLLQLRGQDVVALPVHDCLVVGETHEAFTKGIMEETFMRHTGVEAVVSRE